MNNARTRLGLTLIALSIATASGCGGEPPTPTNPVTEGDKKEAEAIIQKEYGPRPAAKK